jgi:hypothetical protein
MKLDINPGINHPEHVLRTHAGMAYFAQTGPAETWCEQCVSYSRSSCAKYTELTRKTGKTFSGQTPSCKYFEPKGKTNDPR